MAMTKKEKDRLAEVERELRLAKALSWPRYVPTIVPPLENGASEKIVGFAIFPYRARDRFSKDCVEHGASSPIAHITSSDVDRVMDWAFKGGFGGSQRPCTLYATRRDGLMAVRNILTRDFATVLADLDAAIDAEAI